MTSTRQDVTAQVRAAVEANGPELAAGIDVDAIVDELVEQHGLDVDVDELDHDAFWSLVQRHDRTQADAPPPA